MDMEPGFKEDYGEFVDAATDASKSLTERAMSASLLLEDDFATSKLDLQTEVLCRVLRADKSDFSKMITLARDREVKHELRRALNTIARLENEPKVLVRASDMLAFCGNRDSINPLLMVVGRDGSEGMVAANAALDALSLMAANVSTPKETDVFLKRLQNARSQKELSRNYGKSLEQILSALRQKKHKHLKKAELMRWIAGHKPQLSNRLEGPERRMRARAGVAFGGAKQ